MSGALRRILLVAARELRAERRQADGLGLAVTFTVVLVLVESLVIGPAVARDPVVAAALLWIAVTFAGLLVTSRSFDRELEDDAFDALLALPGGRDALYAGKVAALAALLAVVAAIGGTLSVVLLDLPVRLPGNAALVIVLGVVAIPTVVVLDVLLALRLRARAALVPVLALPVLVPQLIATSQGTAAALIGDQTSSFGWSALIAAFTLVHAVLGLTIGGAAVE